MNTTPAQRPWNPSRLVTLGCHLAIGLCAVNGLFAFSPPRDTAGPLTLEIADPGDVKALEQPIAITVTARNSGAGPLRGTLRISVIDEWRIEGEPTQPLSLPAKGTQTLSFRVIAAKGTYAALYPVHARAEVRAGDGSTLQPHAILILSVAPDAVRAASPATGPSAAVKLSPRGRLRLDISARDFQTRIALKGTNAAPMPPGWHGSDPETGASVSFNEMDRGDRRHAISIHPPWRKGWGDAYLDYRVALPKVTPLALDFATAIRDSDVKREGASDGVDFRVLVSEGGPFKGVFARFSAAKQWEPAHVDLSTYAGREITLRLFTGPGPKHNTSCDSSFWAEPTLSSGPAVQPEPEPQRAARRQQALELARAALSGKTAPWSWRLQSEAATTGAALVPGPNGLADAWLAFADDRRTLAFEGFTIQVSGEAIAAPRTGWICDRVQKQFDHGKAVITHEIFVNDARVPAQVRIWAEHGALRFAFSMPGVKRDARGEPRFTSLLVGSASETARRVYAGFGNVIEDPGRFELRGGGFTLSTRHVGMDFANGLSLVQASDIFPDSFRVDPETHRYALVTRHDATLSLLPSSHGAFAAARAYRHIAGFKPAGGVASILGRICLDQWGGDYREAADSIEQAARYGLTNAVFVKHVWQRWGYDYRLPDICPPAGNTNDFLAMVAACKRHGILFCPHDNYIDFYPDATGYSYDHILFNADGTPQKAWYNKGRQAQSYRWSPIAFFPWLENNLKLMKAGFAPTSCFVDVFSAIPPIDFYDRQGRFYPRTVTAERWGAAFDRIREVLGNNAPTISEAGQDGLIGHLDAAQSDHSGWLPDIKDPNAHFRWSMKAGDAERTPWHDMASHGSFVLLAGGLGPRYAGGQDNTLHGYGSDDYLSLTVLGGRNPMCDGPFSRRAVMTYWLLHDVSAILARSEMLAHEFAGEDIHRQTVRFSNAGSVQVNRGQTDWSIDGQTLPQYGFIARVRGVEASITRRGGIISAFAQSPGVLFADARPVVNESQGQVLPQVTRVEDLGSRRFRVHIDWRVLQPVPPGYRPFLHFTGNKSAEGEGILFQGSLNLDATKLSQTGTHPSVAEVKVPEAIAAPAAIGIRCGLYQPTAGGNRLRLLGPVDSTGRARGGEVHLERGPGNASVLRWQPEPPDPTLDARNARLNLGAKPVDFGPVVTTGAFRLSHRDAEWELVPLPSSGAFQVELRLDRLSARGRKVTGITAVDLAGKEIGTALFQQQGETVRFTTSAAPFAYRLRFAR